MSAMREWPTPEYDGDDTPDVSMPCAYCGAGTHEPCLETCETLAPADTPHATDWSNVADAWSRSPWAAELTDTDSPWEGSK